MRRLPHDRSAAHHLEVKASLPLFRIGFRNKVAVLLQRTYSAFSSGRDIFIITGLGLPTHRQVPGQRIAELIAYATANRLETWAVKTIMIQIKRL